jgi:hypothetical protein
MDLKHWAHWADFLTGKFPVITEDRQIHSLDSNMQSNGMQTRVNGQFEPTFYKRSKIFKNNGSY